MGPSTTRNKLLLIGVLLIAFAHINTALQGKSIYQFIRRSRLIKLRETGNGESHYAPKRIHSGDDALSSRGTAIYRKRRLCAHFLLLSARIAISSGRATRICGIIS